MNFDFNKYDSHLSKTEVMRRILEVAVNNFCDIKNYSARRKEMLLSYLNAVRALARNREVERAIFNLSWERTLSRYENNLLTDCSEDCNYYEFLLLCFEDAHPKIARDANLNEFTTEYRALGALEGKKIAAEELQIEFIRGE